MVQRKALGRGLSALIPSGVPEDSKANSEGLLLVNIDEIYPNPLQPRKSFDQGKIEDLANSIRENGVIQPLVVKKAPEGYVLIAGERRWRAAQKAEFKKVPIIIKEADEKSSLALSLVENIQREDLNPIEEAEAYQKLLDLHDYTQEEIGKQVGKSRTSITNFLRLLKLNKKIKEDLIQNKISMGHARAYLGLDSSAQQNEAHRQVLKKDLSVRQTENLIKRMKKGLKTQPDKKAVQHEFLINELRKRLGTKVSIIQRGKKGKLIIEFYSPDELERIFSILAGRER